MSKVICEREDIVAIADAVRSKGNTTEEMTLGEIETAVYNIKSAGVDKIQRWIELNGNSAQYLFYYFSGESVDEIMDGADTSNITSLENMFNNCRALTSVPLFNTSNVSTMSYMFAACYALTSVPLFNTSNVSGMKSMFYNCRALHTVPSLDMRNVTTCSSMFETCKALTECWVRNIKTDLQVGVGDGTGTYHYGHLLTLESLLHLCKECRKTTSSRTLTVGTANLTKLDGVYVKLIDITDEMRAEDDLIDEKYPFVQCESTDDGAMTVADYMALKKWTLK